MDNKCCNHDCNQGRDCPLRDVWTACLDCGQRVTSDSIHTCSPQLKELTDEEIGSLIPNIFYMDDSYSKNLYDDAMKFARAILQRAYEK